MLPCGRSRNDVVTVHDFLDYNPAAAELSVDRDAAALRMKIGRALKRLGLGKKKVLTAEEHSALPEWLHEYFEETEDGYRRSPKRSGERSPEHVPNVRASFGTCSGAPSRPVPSRPVPSRPVPSPPSGSKQSWQELARVDDVDDEDYFPVIWACFSDLCPLSSPSQRQPSRKESAVAEEWRDAGVPVGAVVEVIRERPEAHTKVQVLHWFQAAVSEAWATWAYPEAAAELSASREALLGLLGSVPEGERRAKLEEEIRQAATSDRFDALAEQTAVAVEEVTDG